MKKIFLIIIVGICSSILFGQNQQSNKGTLTINAFNFENDEGDALIILFRESDEFPDKPFVTKSEKIKDKKVKIVIADIPYGNYALIVDKKPNLVENM